MLLASDFGPNHGPGWHSDGNTVKTTGTFAGKRPFDAIATAFRALRGATSQNLITVQPFGLY